MNIALVVNTKHPVTKDTGFGVENFTYQLIEELMVKKHNVNLYASGDSIVPCKLKNINKKNLYSDKSINKDHYSYYEDYIFIEAIKNANKGMYDLIHSQDHNRGILFSHLSKVPVLSTFHDVYDKNRSPFDLIKKANSNNKNHTLITVSQYQKKILESEGFINLKTIYNGINIDNIPLFQPNSVKKNHFLFLSRLNLRKGIDTAVEVAKKTKKNLKIYGYINIGSKEEIILKEKITQEIKNYPNIQLFDTVYNRKKWQQFAEAKLLIFPIRWEEPFGLVMIESMACGTPVVAYARGAVPEVIEDGETGYVVNPSNDHIRGNFTVKKTGLDGLQEAVERIYNMSNSEYTKMQIKCRKRVEEKFTIKKMASEYEKVYQEIINNKIHE